MRSRRFFHRPRTGKEGRADRERGNGAFRLLDRYVGIPFLAGLALFHRKRRLPGEINTIGTLKTAGIGDTILLAGPLADLRTAFPRARIVFFAGGSNYDAARLLLGPDTVVRLPMRNLSAALRLVRQSPVDVMLDFGPWPIVNALLTLLGRTRFTVGFRTPGQYRHYGYDAIVEHSSQIHELENYRRLLGALRVTGSHRPTLRVPTDGDCRELGRDFMVFHLWPGGYRSHLKEWPTQDWARLIDEFTARGYSIALTGGPSDRERNQHVIHLVSAERREMAVNLAGRPLAEGISLLAKARLVVSVNTGMMHAAAALDVPLVAIHGPTSAKRWGPVSQRAVIVQSPLPCCGYLNLGWEYPPSPPPCMESISYESVRDACYQALSAAGVQLLAAPGSG